MTIGEPKIDYREEQCYMGLRMVTPFKGMLSVRDRLLKTLRTWVNRHGVAECGPYFFRLNVIDMRGPMDIEVGFIVPEPMPDDGLIRAGLLPAGRYASLIYSQHDLRSNKALLDWGAEQGLQWDRWEDPSGDAFRCRYEAYLTDYRREPRKKQWQIELAIKLAD